MSNTISFSPLTKIMTLSGATPVILYKKYFKKMVRSGLQPGGNDVKGCQFVTKNSC